MREFTETLKSVMSVVSNQLELLPSTKILGRSTSSEGMHSDYRFLDQDLKLSVTRLSKGELLVQHAVFRQPVKIIFPMPAYKQELQSSYIMSETYFKCGVVSNVECGVVSNVECGVVSNVECGVVSNVECGVRSGVECGVRSYNRTIL